MTHEELARVLLTERFATPQTRGTDEPDDAAAVARRCAQLCREVAEHEKEGRR